MSSNPCPNIPILADNVANLIVHLVGSASQMSHNTENSASYAHL
jgi:hypothetical protein